MTQKNEFFIENGLKIGKATIQGEINHVIFTPRYDPTASPSHGTCENSIKTKKLKREVDIQLLHDSCFCSDVKLKK